MDLRPFIYLRWTQVPRLFADFIAWATFWRLFPHRDFLPSFFGCQPNQRPRRPFWCLFLVADFMEDKKGCQKGRGAPWPFYRLYLWMPRLPDPLMAFWGPLQAAIDPTSVKCCVIIKCVRHFANFMAVCKKFSIDTHYAVSFWHRFFAFISKTVWNLCISSSLDIRFQTNTDSI